MSQKTRYILAMALCLGILVVWTLLFPARRTEKPPERQPADLSKTELRGDSEEPRPSAPQQSAQPTAALAEAFPAAEEDITFETKYLRAVLTTRGGALKSLEILPADGPQYAIKIIDCEGQARGRLSLVLTDCAEHVGEKALFLVLGRTQTGIEFASDWRDDWRLVKKYEFAAGKEDSPYAFRLTLRFENRAGTSRPVRFRLTGSAGITMADPFVPEIHGQTLDVLEGGATHHEKHDVSAIFDKPLEHKARRMQWAAVTNKYFATALIYADEKPPVSDAALRPLLKADEGGAKDPRQNSVVASLGYETAVPAGDGGNARAYEMPFIFYAGPRQEDKAGVLLRYKLTDLAAKFDWPIFGFLFGWLVEPLSKIILTVLKGLHAALGNYGVAIIMLTLLLRLVMFPLSKKQQESMQKMQRLGPKIKVIKEKFKSNRQKQNEETMKLYKEQGVNPAAGCLPVLLQMPMFLGLFFTLRYAVDLRRAWFLYISDLSLPDGCGLEALRLGFTVPLIGLRMDYFNILPLVMIAVWVLQMALAPKAVDPQQRQQQKMMIVMPVIFGFLLYNYAAGLALYMIGNMFFGMVEQHIVKKIVARKIDA